MSSELQNLFRADQDERTNHPDYGTPEYWLLRERDAERRKRLEDIVASGGLKEPEDYYRAAWILNHGESVEEIWQAHDFWGNAGILCSFAIEVSLTDFATGQ